MANQRNKESLAALQASFADAGSFFLVDYQGLTAGGLSDLRKQMRDSGSRLVVAKNTLIHLALTGRGLDFAQTLKGPTAVVFVGEDVVGPAKALVEFAKKNDKGAPAPKGGLLDGSMIGPERFEQIASLPSKRDLQAELLGVLQAAPQNLVGVLGAKLQEFVGILDAKAQKAS